MEKVSLWLDDSLEKVSYFTDIRWEKCIFAIGRMMKYHAEEEDRGTLKGNLLGYKGAIFENLMADFLCKSGQKLYYFHKDSGLELDFLVRYTRVNV